MARFGVVVPLIGILAMGAGCASAPRWATESEFNHRERRGTGRPEAILRVSGERFTLESAWLPGATIRGEIAPDADSGWTAWVDEVEVVANWANGWTWARIDASGTIRIEPAGDAPDRRADAGLPAHIRLTMGDRVDLWQLTAGEIRYYDDYLRGEDGLRRVQGRLDRSAAYAEWMVDADVADVPAGDAHRDGAHGQPLVPRFRSRLARSDDPLPDWLEPLIESGTVERDLTEAGELVQFHFNLDYLENALLDGSVTWENTEWK